MWDKNGRNKGDTGGKGGYDIDTSQRSQKKVIHVASQNAISGKKL